MTLTPQTPDKKQEAVDPVAKFTAAQCVSPANASILGPSILEKTEQMKREQKNLIAQREFNDCSPLSSSSSTSIGPNQASVLVTPPSSTTSKYSSFSTSSKHHTRTKSLAAGVNSPSFGSQRKDKPSPLNVTALVRERQYSGPFSANPLLSRKKKMKINEVENGEGIDAEGDSGSDSHNNDSDRENETNSDGKKRQRFTRSHNQGAREPALSPSNMTESSRLPKLPHLISAPFASAALNNTWNPFPTTPLYSAKRSFSMGFPMSPSENIPTPQTNDPQGNLIADKLFQSLQGRSSNGTQRSEKKAKFLQLCGQIWDLLEN